jgi:hypothetical protein
MRSILLALIAISPLMALSQPAAARGCIKGAIVGGIAGHYAGHHGLLGAAGGCIVGRHMANRRALDEQRQYEMQTGPQPYREPYAE